MPWQEILGLLNTWWARTVAVAGILLAIYYGPRKMLETWDWYIDRFVDMPVADIVRRRAFLPPLKSYFGSAFDQPEKVELCYKAKDIARVLNRNEKAILKSLLRLERRGKVVPTDEGWHWNG